MEYKYLSVLFSELPLKLLELTEKSSVSLIFAHYKINLNVFKELIFKHLNLRLWPDLHRSSLQDNGTKLTIVRFYNVQTEKRESKRMRQSDISSKRFLWAEGNNSK